MIECLAVGAGGFLGAVCRYLIGLIPVKEWMVFPIKTFLINLAGCFAIGIIAALASKHSLLPPRLVLFLQAGVCGGFTTFSLVCAGNPWPDKKRQSLDCHPVRCFQRGAGHFGRIPRANAHPAIIKPPAVQQGVF